MMEKTYAIITNNVYHTSLTQPFVVLVTVSAMALVLER